MANRQKMMLTVNYQVVYDVDTALYDTTDPKEMAHLDQSAIEYNPFDTLKHLFDVLPKGQLKFQIVPVLSDAQKNVETTGLKTE